MRLKPSLVLYTAAALCAIAALAVVLHRPGTSGPDTVASGPGSALSAQLEGSMKKLVFHPAPKPVSQTAFESEDGGTAQLGDYRGRIVLVNFWATWCAPCRKEMPMLAALERDLGGDDFTVLTIATGRNPPQAMKDFFAEIGVDNLPRHRDADMALAREMGAVGLPTTLILDREGREIARMMGDAEWNSPSAVSLLRSLIAAVPASG